MEATRKKKVAVLFTFGVSLQVWKKAGLLYRDSQLYKILQDRNIDISFITYGDAGDIKLGKEMGIDVICNKNNIPKFIYYLFLPFLRYTQLKEFDIIKTHQFVGVLPAVFMKVFFKKKYIARAGFLPSYFSIHDEKGGLSRYARWVISLIDEFLACRFADIVVVPSQEELEYLKKKYHLDIKKARVNTNWIDTQKFCMDPNIRKKNRSVIFIGRFESQKNPLLFLKSIKNIKNVKATMIGSGRMSKDIQDFIRIHGIDCDMYDEKIDNEKLSNMLNEHLVYVLPTSFEGGSPKTILEAMSCGLPIVSSDTFGTRNAFVDGQHGFKCPLKEEYFERKIRFLFDHDELRKVYGRQARRYVIDNFSLEKVLERELDIINSLL